MATLTELKDTLEEALKDPALKAEIYARPLRPEGYLTTGGRGSNAPQMTVTDCANLLIAIMSSAPAFRAADTVKLYRGLRLLRRPPGPRGRRSPRIQRTRNLAEVPLTKIRDVHFFGELVEFLILRSADGSIGRLAAGWPDDALDPGLSLRVIGPRPAAVLRLSMPERNLTLAYGADDETPSTPTSGLVRAAEIHEDVLIALGELFR
jgi:hypothetical protein